MYNLVSSYDALEMQARGDVTSDKVTEFLKLFFLMHLAANHQV